MSATNKGGVFVADRVRSNQLPNLGVLYTTEREERVSECPTSPLPAERVRFEARVETELKQVGIVLSQWHHQQIAAVFYCGYCHTMYTIGLLGSQDSL